MKSAGWIMLTTAFFFIPVGIVYGFLTNFEEMVGFPALVVTGLMSIMVGGYILLHNKSVGAQAQDNEAGEISDEAYEYGFYSPWSWWPLVLATGAAIMFVGVAVGFWIMPFGAVISLVGLIGLVYEYDRGDHAH